MSQSSPAAMDFRLIVSHSWTVKFAHSASAGWTFDHGKGVCWLDPVRIEGQISDAIGGRSFGGDLREFLLGLEITDAPAGFGFEDTRDYLSYRPSRRALLSVCQLDWPGLKHADAEAQFEAFRTSALAAVARVATMKRKPRGFDAAAFCQAYAEALSGLRSQDGVTPANDG